MHTPLATALAAISAHSLETSPLDENFDVERLLPRAGAPKSVFADLLVACRDSNSAGARQRNDSQYRI
jgi:hypothetical protein